MDLPADSVRAVAKALPAAVGPPLFLVGIDGMSGSGKPTIAAALAESRPDLTVIRGDDFYGPEQRDWRSWTSRQGHERYFDHVRLENEVSIPLLDGRPTSYQRYDWTRNELAQWVPVEPQKDSRGRGGLVLTAPSQPVGQASMASASTS